MNFKNRFDSKYKASSNLFGQEPIPILKHSLKYMPSGSALDLGAGNGRNSIYLLSKSFEVTSVDASEEGLNILKQKAGNTDKLKTVAHDITKFETDKKFNLVLAIGLLHFLKKEDVDVLISKMRSWTKTGGINVIGVKMNQNIRRDLPHIFEHNELLNYYQLDGWEVKDYKEMDKGDSKVAFIVSMKM